MFDINAVLNRIESRAFCAKHQAPTSSVDWGHSGKSLLPPLTRPLTVWNSA